MLNMKPATPITEVSPSTQLRKVVFGGSLICLALSALLADLAFSARAAEEPVLAPIFNGKDLSGWRVPEPNPWWTVVDGVLVGQSSPDQKGDVLETKKLYRDVIVECEARWNGKIDSGIFLRKGQKWQCQIGISRSLKKDMTCSIYNGTYEGHEAHGVDRLLKPGDWNKIRIEAIGSKFKIYLNGENVLEWESDAYPEPGPIGLQIHPGLQMKVEYRNLKAAALSDAEPAAK